MKCKPDTPEPAAPLLSAPVSEALLAEIVRRIRTRVADCCIVLFGSHAYGDPRAGSDVDLLVIARTNNGTFAMAGEIYAALSPRSIAIDVVVMTPGMYRQRREGFDPFLREVAAKGRVLHGRLP